MLSFWYSARCHRQLKLMICIGTCLLIYLASTQAQLPPFWVILSLILGMGLHLLYQWSKRRSWPEHQRRLMYWGLNLAPLLLLAVLLLFLPKMQLWAMALQALGFILVGLFMVSIYQQRAKRFDS